MSGKSEQRVYAFTAFSGSRRYITESTIKSLGKEEHTSIIPSPQFWRAFKHYEKYQTYATRVFYPLQDKELSNKLKDALNFEKGQ